MNGDFHWFGDFDECLSIGLTNVSGSSFKSQYCRVGLTPFVLQANQTQPQTIMSWDMALMIGVCVPDSCTKDMLEVIISQMSNFIFLPF